VTTSKGCPFDDCLHPRVLVIGMSIDPHLDAVCSELPDGSYARLHVDEFPAVVGLSLELSGSAPVLNGHDFHAHLDTVDSVWFRQLGAATPSTVLAHPAQRAFSRAEAESSIFGLGALLAGARWYNPMYPSRRAQDKVLQLRVAREAGLVVLPTLVSNDGESVRRFAATHAGSDIVFKTQSSPILDYGDRQAIIYTTVLDAEMIASLPDRLLAPGIFQLRAVADHELRVTIVGPHILAAALRTRFPRGGPNVDWRRLEDDQVDYDSAQLPETLVVQLLDFMQRMELTFAAVDLIVTEAGEYIFLEANPHGAWLWLDKKLGLGVARSLATALVGN
jgi:hypothetical protein